MRTRSTPLKRPCSASRTSSRCASDSPTSSRPAITTPLGSSSRKPASVTFWVATRSGAMPRAKRREGGIGRRGWRARRRSRRQHALADQFEFGPDRLIRLIGWFRRGRRDLRAERDALRNAGLHLAAKGGGECGALRDQFGFGLLDQLVLVDFQEVDAEQRQREHAGEHDKDDEAEAWPPFPARVGRWLAQRAASQRPSLKPTPWTVSIADSQPAPANLARMFLTWLSMVRSAT